MPTKPARIYWDACVFLSYVEETEGRASTIEVLLDQATEGRIELVTSTVTTVEVAFAKWERDGQALDGGAEGAIAELWSPTSPVKLVEFDRIIGERAKRLIRDGLPRGWHLKSKDAIHLATAQRIGTSELHTYDKQLPRYAESLGFTIREPVTAQAKLS